MRSLVGLAILALLLVSCGGGGAAAKTVDLEILIETHGGAGVFGDLYVEGENIIENFESREDLKYTYRVAPGTHVAGTFIRQPNVGRLYCLVTADGETIYEQLTNEDDDTCNVVVSVPS